jgi:hypothetical protein
VQLLHKLRDAKVGGFHPAWVVHRHHPIIVHGWPQRYALLKRATMDN